MAKWHSALARALQLPADALYPAPRIILSGREEVLIGGKAVLREYTPALVRVSRAAITVNIQGRALRILAMDALGICVGGDIEQISFSE